MKTGNYPQPPLARDMLPLTPMVTDRLPPMLFLAALFHALIILGVTFESESVDGGETLTLDVVLLTSTEQRIESPDEAAYIASVSQTGTGNSDERQSPGSPAHGLEVAQELTELLGDISPETQIDQAAHSDVLTSSRNASLRTNIDNAETQESEKASDARMLPAGVAEELPIPVDDRQSDEVFDPDERELVFSVDTRESDLALYLYNWKLKVEAEGTHYYNQRISQIENPGSPVIEVAIGKNGALTEIIVRQTSGSGLVDQAALTVLRSASPYPPIPAHLQKDYDTLRFRYKFEFDRNP